MEIKHINVLKYVINEQVSGSIIILWTCREGKYLKDAVDWCKNKGLIFDYVNENCKEALKFCENNYGKGVISRKIFADIYIDDKSINLDVF